MNVIDYLEFIIVLHMFDLLFMMNIYIYILFWYVGLGIVEVYVCRPETHVVYELGWDCCELGCCYVPPLDLVTDDYWRWMLGLRHL